MQTSHYTTCTSDTHVSISSQLSKHEQPVQLYSFLFHSALSCVSLSQLTHLRQDTFNGLCHAMNCYAIDDNCWESYEKTRKTSFQHRLCKKRPNRTFCWRVCGL